jgi:hypothetical protein
MVSEYVSWILVVDGRGQLSTFANSLANELSGYVKREDFLY